MLPDHTKHRKKEKKGKEKAKGKAKKKRKSIKRYHDNPQIYGNCIMYL